MAGSLARHPCQRVAEEPRELDATTELDDGDPYGLANEYAALVAKLSELTILGGCCGTDERHIEQIARACMTSASPRMAATGIELKRGPD